MTTREKTASWFLIFIALTVELGFLITDGFVSAQFVCITASLFWLVAFFFLARLHRR